ncbi:hypothetical protein L6164_012123 [Bauhinia variegata]|uniref:Uncharacterized protein n=1 Tax=Bauhinia variegata TaxID=167791 RepID=A0ACB9P8H5_BAUVA|nr:hypothetical protein L6164_012123 [Bauhinia variegata]
MKDMFAVFFMLLVASPYCLCIRMIADANPNFNVMDYGAKGDGQTDDSQAFLKVWKNVCNATGTPTLLIPQGKTFLLQPISFMGACNPTSITVELQGDLVAPNSMDAWKWPDSNTNKGYWIRFSDINGLVVNGGGQIDGQGAPWWKYPNNPRPVALSFHNCRGLQLINLTNINSPGGHMSVNGCNGSLFSNLHIIAPGDSPNTDGIDISSSSNVIIQHSEMRTGDDCIAINGGSSFINVTDVACGPGHGISIGSLGKNGAYETVEEIHVKNCSFNGSSNGARIKTWVGGSGYARKITFENINFTATANPVIMDQHYDPRYADTTNSAVKVSDVTYYQLYGTSAVENAIQLDCDNSSGCTNIVLNDINIASSDPGKKTFASCNNAHGISSSCTPAIPCLLN